MCSSGIALIDITFSILFEESELFQQLLEDGVVNFEKFLGSRNVIGVGNYIVVAFPLMVIIDATHRPTKV